MTGVAAPNGLLKIFGNLRILRYEETEAAPDFGTGEAAPIVRLLARKKRPWHRRGPCTRALLLIARQAGRCTMSGAGDLKT